MLNNNHLKKIFFFTLLLVAIKVKAQKIESIYVNLYTDSLKKGTFNYINIDGLLSNGKYLPLDSTHINFWANAGKFSGNNLWIDKDFKAEKINIKVTLIKNPALFKEFVMHIKRNPDPVLKTMEELINENKKKSKSNN